MTDFGEQRSAVIARARAAGIVHFVAIGSGGSLANVENALHLTETSPDISAAIGIHPHDARALDEPTLDALSRFAAHPRVVAVGETGLDYHYHHSTPDEQRLAFRRLIDVARAARKPLTLHVREAHAEARTILGEEHATDVPIVVHCFTGTIDDARAYLDLGCYLSFSGILTFKNADEIRRAAAYAPAERVLVETDCPYLAPLPHRGQRNEPAYLVETAKRLAEIRGRPLDEVAAATVAATRAAFALPAA